MKGEPGIAVGTLGFVASLSLGDVNTIVAIAVGLATLAFVITRWFHFIASRGGLRWVFA